MSHDAGVIDPVQHVWPMARALLELSHDLEPDERHQLMDRSIPGVIRLIERVLGEGKSVAIGSGPLLGLPRD